MTILNTPYLEEIKCPNCGALFTDWDYIDTEFNGMEHIEYGWAECGECGKSFNVENHFTFSHCLVWNPQDEE